MFLFFFRGFIVIHAGLLWFCFAGLHSGGSKPFPDQSMGHPAIFYLVQDHACHFYEDIFNLQFQHVSVMNTTQLLFYFLLRETERRRVQSFNFGSLRDGFVQSDIGRNQSS